MARRVLLLSLILSAACSSKPGWDDLSGKPATFPTDPAAVQRRIADGCPAGQAMVGVEESGAPICAATGEGVTAVAPLEVDAGGAVPSVRLQPCPPGQVLKSLGATWGCALDADTDTTYAAGPGLSLTGGQFSVNFGVGAPGGLFGSSVAAARIDHDHLREVGVPPAAFSGGAVATAPFTGAPALVLGPLSAARATLAIPLHNGVPYDLVTVRLAFVGTGSVAFGIGTIVRGQAGLSVTSNAPRAVDSPSALATVEETRPLGAVTNPGFLVIDLANRSAAAGDVLQVLQVNVIFNHVP